MRPFLLVAAVLGMAAVGAPLLAATEFVAMGDSITAGNSWPHPLQSVFDCTGGCSYGPSDESCGYVRRLDSWIDGWLGAGDHVVNEGKGAEQTTEAISRLSTVLDAECLTPGTCNAVLLMHGTNDMCCSGLSPESVTANLGFMIDEAKSRNIDTLLMTVIRKVYDHNNPRWKAYKNLILALADTKGVESVNPWLPLCPGPGTTCFNNKYYVDASQCTGPGEGDPNIGHLDPDGYKVLTDLIKAEFPAAAPVAPVPTSPTGDITETQPDFVWPEDPDARWWELEVDSDPDTTWWEAAASCSPGGDCIANPGVALAKGAHSWQVRGRNLRGMGDWSAATPFEIWGVPAAPVTSAPTGLVIDATPASAPYEWEPYTWAEDPEATDYDLEVSNGGGSVLMQSFDSSICAAPVCSASPDFDLGADSYTWTAQARNPGATGPVSAPLAFEIWDTVPGEPTPTGPTGDHFEPFAPLYEWLPAAGATEYDIEVKDAGGNVDVSVTGLQASLVCAAGTCSYQGAALADPDDYTFRVLGRNLIGAGTFSSPGADFTVLACANPSPEELVNLEPSPVTVPQTVTYCGQVNATTGTYTVEATGALTVVTREGFSADDTFVVEGELTVRTQ